MRRWHVRGRPRFTSPYRDHSTDVDVHVGDALALGIDVPRMHDVILTTDDRIVFEPLR